MKNQRKLVAVAVLAAALTGGALASAVTLSSSPQTPCTFGALGSSSSCASAKSVAVSKTAPSPAATSTVTQSTVKPLVQKQVQPSTAIAPVAAVPVASTGSKPQLSAVPLPLAGGLLIGSLGIVFATGRSRRKLRR